MKIEEVMKTRKNDENKATDLIVEDIEEKNSEDKTSIEDLPKNFKKVEKKEVPRRCPQDVCNYCTENNFSAIHHSSKSCWRKKNIKKKPKTENDSSDESTSSGSEDLIVFSSNAESEVEDNVDDSKVESGPAIELEDFDPLSPSLNPLETSSETSSTEASDADEELSEEDLQEGDVFEMRSTVIHHPPSCRDNQFTYDNLPQVQPSTSHSRPRMNAVQEPGRPVERRQGVYERTADIPGRLVTEGDLIKYFSGCLDDQGEQVWITARVEKMFKTQQRKYPNYYNVLNENGETLSLSLLPGGNWAVREDDRWKTF